MKGHLFDLYHVEETVYLWIRDCQGNMHCFFDKYYPTIYIHGAETHVQKILKKLYDLDSILEKPVYRTRKHFYTNENCEVLEIKIKKPSILRRIAGKLYLFYGLLDIYHSDIDLLSHYLNEKKLFPLALVEIAHKNYHVENIVAQDNIDSFDYEIPNLGVMNMRLTLSHKLPISEKNRILFESKNHSYEIWHSDTKKLLSKVNAVLELEDPDVILSRFGDQAIFPYLFRKSNESRIPLQFDRDKSTRTRRKILTSGTSYNTYGNWIYRAPSYPLFGRWHIDNSNSFVYKETELTGVLELARIARMPVQKLARSSTGTALTNIETFTAIQNGYLVPWQKSSLENPKTAYQLLRIDKGGLIFQPSREEGIVFENVAQLDFSQMYPSLMVNRNISPETVNCVCCNRDMESQVPGTHYHTCKNRKGVVSESLEKVLQRRKYYKKRMKETSGPNYEIYNSRQNCLKWMLVTSFGYLGYRNAKFGKLESHEAVTAWGRETLLIAKTIAEDKGYEVLHAITDCIFTQKKDKSKFDPAELSMLCNEITQSTGVELALDGIYSWVVFPSSKTDENIGVMNRYFGKYYTGQLKVRGLFVRRKDIPPFVQEAQLSFLETMKKASTKKELSSLHDEMNRIYEGYISEVQSKKIPWEKLLIRKTVGKNLADYEVDNGTSLVLKELETLNARLSPGEKVQYIVKAQKSRDKSKRYSSLEKLSLFENEIFEYDIRFYENMVFEAFKEVWENFAPPNYFLSLKEKQSFLFAVTHEF